MTDPNQPNSPEWAAEFDARLDATTTDESAQMSKRQSAAIIALEATSARGAAEVEACVRRRFDGGAK